MATITNQSVIKNNIEEKKTDIGLLEEDDEFEEFPAEWTENEENNEESNVWEDNWDDDNVEDDFSKQLRAELERQSIGNNEIKK
ncbi:unnamed protein product [Gordionus sp. m RMFG-2023]|uniref:26S proteasome complex subunit SEM1-like n=1 Tax=Gordionus sp. m RMFG-2023 TaxID=3053472 RepID=UPI0030E5098A